MYNYGINKAFNRVKMDRGIPNLGNTCYIASILQCLRYSKDFVCPLLKHRSSEDSRLHQDFVDLMFASAPVATLKSFVSSLSLSHSEFRLLRQCDAHELFIYLIDSFFSKHKKYTNPFQGKYASFITCQTCQHVSKTSYPFVSVSVEMPVGKIVDVETLLRQFEKEESLDDPITCDACRTKRTSNKRIEIGDAGPILVVHLKRFFGMNKNTAPVIINDTLPIKSRSYKLYAVCNHVGSIRGGHYTASVRKRSGEWLLCNDAFVTTLNSLPKTSAEAYILFYYKIP